MEIEKVVEVRLKIKVDSKNPKLCSIPCPLLHTFLPTNGWQAECTLFHKTIDLDSLNRLEECINIFGILEILTTDDKIIIQDELEE